MKKQTTIRHTLVMFMLTLGLAFPGGRQVLAETFNLTLGIGIPAQILPFTKEVRDFWVPEIEKRVAARTNHKINWTLHFSASVVKLPDEFEAVQDGLLDVGMVFPIFENPALFLHNFSYYAPFGVPDEEKATQVNLKIYNDNPWLKEVFEQKHNQKFLASATYERYDLITTFPVKSLKDLEGHKIAAAGPNLPWIKTIGCVPVQSIVTEAYTSLQTGVYDGWVLPVSAANAFKLNDVAEYYTLVGFGAISGPVLTMNLDIWNMLPKEVQDIFLEVGPEYSMRVAEVTKQKHETAMSLMKEKGVVFFNLSKAEKKLWMEKLGPLANEKAKEADSLGQPGSKVMKDYVSEMEKIGYEWPLRWEIK